MRWALLLALAAAAAAGPGDVRLLTDDAIPRYLERGRELAQAGQWERAIEILQSVVDGDPAVFPDLDPELRHSAVYSPDGVLYRTVRDVCLEELARMPPEGLLAYRAAYDGPAREALEAARATPGVEERLAAYAAVYERYFISSSGDDALEAAADLLADLGRPARALALYRRVLDLYPEGGDRALPLVFAKAASCAARIGDAPQRDSLLERLRADHPGARVLVEGEPLAADLLAGAAPFAVQRAAVEAPEDWQLPSGAPSGARVAEDIPEGSLPKEPFWSVSLEERDPRLHVAQDRWRVRAHDREPAHEPARAVHRTAVLPYPAVRPIVVGERVYYKDYAELLGRDLATGALESLVYRDDPPTADPRQRHPLFDVRPQADAGTNQGGVHEDRYRYLDYGGNAAVAHRGRVYVTEPRDAAGNHLLCYGDDATTRWGWHPDAAVYGLSSETREWWEDYSKHRRSRILGPGVPSGGLLYTLAEETEPLRCVRLWAFDVESGWVLFRTFLHHLEAPEQGDGLVPGRRRPPRQEPPTPSGASVAVDGGTAYALTGNGILAAVDALPPGRVRWIRRYARGDGVQLPYNPPVVAAGKVIAAPWDSTDIFAVDAATGELAWRVPRPAIVYIVGVADGAVVLAGTRVLAIDIATGAVRWGDKRLDGAAYGRGFCGERYAYVPAYVNGSPRATIQRFDLKTGESAPPLEFAVERLGNLVYAGGRLIVAGDEHVLCFTTMEAELERVDAALARDGERAELRLRRARILAKGGRGAEAAAEFAQAVQAAAREGDPHRLGVAKNEAAQHVVALAEATGDTELLAGMEALDPHPLWLAQARLVAANLFAATGRPLEALDALEVLSREHRPADVVMDGRVLPVPAAVKLVREQVLAARPDAREEFARRLTARIAEAEAASDRESLLRLRTDYQGWPAAVEAYFALARLEEAAGDLDAAKLALRCMIRDLPDHARRAEAHLRLALLLAASGDERDAQREREAGLRRLDEEARVRFADLLAELAATVPPAPPAARPEELSLPLHRAPAEKGAPAAVEGVLPEPVAALFADGATLVARDEAGEEIWTHVAATDAPIGPPDDPATLPAAAAVAAARMLRAHGGGILVGDVYGLRRLDAATGRVVWRLPAAEVDSARDARSALGDLRASLMKLRSLGSLPRRAVLPRYRFVPGRDLVVCADSRGVYAVHAERGSVAWTADVPPQTTVGAPAVRGELIAVGLPEAGFVRVYDLDGRSVGRYVLPEGSTLIAPPVLDPLGRLLVVAADARGENGALIVADARDGAPDHALRIPVRGPNAAVLHADDRLVVFHDGGSLPPGEGGGNLHFARLDTGEHWRLRAPDLLRDVDVLEAGNRIFVFTHTRGLAQEGARLFRISLDAPAVFGYALPPAAPAYAPPLLTRHHVAVAGADERRAFLWLLDRDASAASAGPRGVFVDTAGRLLSEAAVTPAGAPRYDVAISLSAGRGSLRLGSPHGAAVFGPPNGR